MEQEQASTNSFDCRLLIILTLASSSVKIVLHIANGWDASSVASYYNNIFIPGELSLNDIDIMAFSFYPFYGTGATLSALQSSLQAMVTKYGKVG